MSSVIVVGRIDSGDKSWLKREARRAGVSMAQFVRLLIREKRERTERHEKPSDVFRRHFGPEHGVELRRLPEDVLRRFAELSLAVLEEAAGDDDLNRRILASYRGFLAEVRGYHAISEQAYLNARSALGGEEPCCRVAERPAATPLGSCRGSPCRTGRDPAARHPSPPCRRRPRQP